MTNAQKWAATAERLRQERLAARTPEQVAADKKAAVDYLASLAARVTVDRGVLLGEPYVLSEICRMFGFKNPCRDGRVYLTPDKHRVLFAASTCGVCRRVTADNDRLPFGDGVAHAACAMRAQVETGAGVAS